AFFPFIFIGAGIINNQHEGLLLEALAIYFVLKRRSWLNLLIAAICIAVAQVLRPTAVVVAMAFLVSSFRASTVCPDLCCSSIAL
ncbi:hypothetical protein ACI3PM_17780, partial [Lactiplantibacillus plantarum]